MKKVELNLIDKAIAFVNPQAAVERLASRAKLTAFEYDATQYNRQRRGPSSLSGAEGFRSNYDRVELLKRSRDLAENVGLVRGLLMKFASHCAGNISYQARTESPQVNSDVEAYWNEWWDKCDLSGRNTGSFLMQIAMMSMLRDGDFLFVLVRDQQGNLKLQGIEADRLGDPNRTYTSLNLISGIHVDQETGSPVGYDIYLRTYGNAYIFQTTVPASQAFHLYDPLRIDQYRGISAFHTAINDCVDIYEIIASEKMAAKYASSQAGIVKRNNNNASDLSSLTNDLNADNQGIKLETIEPGKVSYLEVNEDIIFPDGPNRPSGAFAEFHKILLRNICMGVGIPYSFAVDPSSMSGPTARLEMQQAGRTFRRYQKLLEDRVLRPLKNIVIADGVSRGLIANNLGSKSTKGIFNFGANVSIDLGRESASAIAEFKTGLRTAADIYSERGQDFETSLRQRAQEASFIKKLSKEYDIPAVAISDIVESLVYAQQAVERSGQGQATDNAQTGQAYFADQALNGAQVASLIQIINAVASGAISKEGSVSIITAAFPFITPEEASRIVEGVNVGTIAPLSKTPATTEAIPTKMQDEPQDEDAIVVVPPIKEQDTASRTTGGDGDIDVGEEREPTEKGATEDTQKIGGKQIDNNLEEFSRLDNKSVKMLIGGILNACELGKYSDIDFTPPQGAREAAKRALEVRGEKPASQRGMTSVGIARARDLIAGKSLSPDTIRRMHSFFSRHEVDKKGQGWDDQGKGWQAWNGWGGDAGFSWVKKLIKQMDSRDEKLEEPASCPIATQDVKTNLSNRKNAVDDANYGPANPNEPNEDYWKAKANEFQGDVAAAKKMRCGNCAAFNQTNKLLGCIKKGIGEDANEVAVGGDLGYCEIFDFKCAAKRTCDAWIVGGPITDDKKKVTNFVAGRDCGQDEGGTFGPDNKCAVGYGRPAEKGGYTPERPGGKMPKDYVRPTPQDRGGKTEKSQEKPVKTKGKSVLDSYKYDKNGEAEVSEKDHIGAVKHAYMAGDTYEKQKLDISQGEKEVVDNYRKQSGGAWSKYERALAEGDSREEALQRALTGSLSSPERALQNVTADGLTEKDLVTYSLYKQTNNEEGLKKFYSKVNDMADAKIKELNKLTNTKFDSEQTLYRGFRADGYESKNILNDIKSGKPLNFTSFMSASSDPDVASSYARREDEINSGNSILFKIKAKRGISTINSNNPNFESDLKETILPKGQYKVLKTRTVKTKNSKTHFVEIEQL